MRSVGKGDLSAGVRSHALSKWCLMIGIMWEASSLGMSLGRLQRRSNARARRPKRGLIAWNLNGDTLVEASGERNA